MEVINGSLALCLCFVLAERFLYRGSFMLGVFLLLFMRAQCFVARFRHSITNKTDASPKAR